MPFLEGTCVHVDVYTFLVHMLSDRRLRATCTCIYMYVTYLAHHKMYMFYIYMYVHVHSVGILFYVCALPFHSS